LSALSDTVAALHELRNEAESQGQSPIAELCDALIEAYERLEDHTLDDTAYAALGNAHECLLDMFDAIASDQRLPAARAEIEALARAKPIERADETLEDVEIEPLRTARVVDFPTFVRPEAKAPRTAHTTNDRAVAHESDVPLLDERVDDAHAA